MNTLNIEAWTSKNVEEWLSGLPDELASYAPVFRGSGVTGARLLQFSFDDFYILGVEKVGHRELFVQTVEQLRNLHYGLETWTLQWFALRAQKNVKCLYCDLKSRSIASLQSMKHILRPPADLLTVIASVTESVKALVEWLDGPQFRSQQKIRENRNSLVQSTLLLARKAIQRDQSLIDMREDLMTLCLNIRDKCQYFLTECNDSSLMLTSSLELATIKKRPIDDWGLHISSSYLGIHIIEGISPCSPAETCNKISVGDEVVQVNRCTVIGWQISKLIERLQTNSREVILLVKKPASHVPLIRRVPSPKRAIYHALDSHISPVSMRSAESDNEVFSGSRPGDKQDVSSKSKAVKRAESMEKSSDLSLLVTRGWPLTSRRHSFDLADLYGVDIDSIDLNSINAHGALTSRTSESARRLRLDRYKKARSFAYEALLTTSEVNLTSDDIPEISRKFSNSDAVEDQSTEGSSVSSPLQLVAPVKFNSTQDNARALDQSSLAANAQAIPDGDDSSTTTAETGDHSSVIDLYKVGNYNSLQPRQKPQILNDTLKTVSLSSSDIVSSLSTQPEQTPVTCDKSSLTPDTKEAEKVLPILEESQRICEEFLRKTKNVPTPCFLNRTLSKSAECCLMPSCDDDIDSTYLKRKSGSYCFMTALSSTNDYNPDFDVSIEKLTLSLQQSQSSSYNEMDEAHSDLLAQLDDISSVSKNHDDKYHSQKSLESQYYIKHNTKGSKSTFHSSHNTLSTVHGSKGIPEHVYGDSRYKRACSLVDFNSMPIADASRPRNTSDPLSLERDVSPSKISSSLKKLRGLVSLPLSLPSSPFSPRRRKTLSSQTSNSDAVSVQEPEQPLLLGFTRKGSTDNSDSASCSSPTKPVTQEVNTPVSAGSVKRRHAFRDSEKRISCQDLGRGDCDGFLIYHSPRHKTKVISPHKWSRRWCVLHNRCLYVYLHQNSDLPEFTIDLIGLKVSPLPKYSRLHRYVFEISGDPDISSHIFSCETQRSMTKWTNMLGLAAISFDVTEDVILGGFKHYSGGEEALNRKRARRLTLPDEIPGQTSSTFIPVNLDSDFGVSKLPDDDSVEMSFEALSQQLTTGDLVSPGRDIQSERESLLRSSEILESEQPEDSHVRRQLAVRRLLSIERTLKAKEAEISAIDRLLSTEKLTPELLSSFQHEFPELLGEDRFSSETDTTLL